MLPSLRLFAGVGLFLLGSACASGEEGAGTESGQGGADGSSSGPPPTAFHETLCSDGVCWVRPTPQGNRLSAVTVLADGEAWAAGLGGAVLRRREGRWLAADSPTTSNLRAVAATGPNDVWIAGDAGTLLHFDGVRLARVESGTKTNLRGAFALSPNDAWFVGESGEVLHFDGKTVRGSSTASDALNAVWGSGPGDIWAVGGTFNVGVIGHFDGNQWSWTRSGLSGAGWNGVHGTARDDVWIAGNYGRIAHFDGASWSETPRALGTGDARAVFARTRGEAFFLLDDAVYRFIDGSIEPFVESRGGDAFAVTKSAEPLVVGIGGRITRGVEPSAVDEVAAQEDEIFSVTTDEHVIVHRAPLEKASTLLDLTTGLSVPYPSDTPDRLVVAEDGTPIIDRGLSTVARAAYSYAEGGKWVDVPNPPSLPDPPKGKYWSGRIAAARTKDDVWFIGSAPLANGDSGKVAALVHGVGGVYEMVVLPQECGEGSVVRPFAENDAVLACGCYVARLSRSSIETSTSWSCEQPMTKDGNAGYLSAPTKASITVDGDSILVGYVLSEYAFTADFVYYSHTPVLSRITKGKRERLELPAGLSSFDSAEVFFAPGPGGRMAAYLGSGNGRVGNLLEIDGSKVTAKRMPVSDILRVHSTKGGTYISAGGLLRAR